jgi:shikimate O-hydroxycinnamoyltransferase
MHLHVDNRISCEPAEYIKPAIATQHRVLELSPFDNLAPQLSFHFQFVYKNEMKDKNFMHADTLKKSLSQLLNDFPLHAGRAKVADRNWYIDCNDAGVPFVVAHADMELDDYVIGDYDHLPKGLCTQWTKPEDPLWQIQVTYFKCGGVVLVSEMLHQLGDGETNAMTMRKWAKLHSTQSFVPPVLDRSSIRPSNTKPPTSFPQWHQSDELPNYDELFAKLPLCTAKMITFTAEEIQAMKNDAHDLNNAPFVSSNDAICAHMWRLITKARNLPANSRTCLLHAVNVRQKLIPALKSGTVLLSLKLIYRLCRICRNEWSNRAYRCS